MIWPIMHHNMLRLLQNIGEKFSLLWFTTPDNTSNQGAEGAAGPDHRLLLLRESYWRKIETWNFLRRCPGHQPRGWKHNEAPRTRNPGALTLSVWLQIHCCHIQEGSCGICSAKIVFSGVPSHGKKKNLTSINMAFSSTLRIKRNSLVTACNVWKESQSNVKTKIQLPNKIELV